MSQWRPSTKSRRDMDASAADIIAMALIASPALGESLNLRGRAPWRAGDWHVEGNGA